MNIYFKYSKILFSIAQNFVDRLLTIIYQLNITRGLKNRRPQSSLTSGGNAKV